MALSALAVVPICSFDVVGCPRAVLIAQEGDGSDELLGHKSTDPILSVALTFRSAKAGSTIRIRTVPSGQRPWARLPKYPLRPQFTIYYSPFTIIIALLTVSLAPETGHLKPLPTGRLGLMPGDVACRSCDLFFLRRLGLDLNGFFSRRSGLGFGGRCCLHQNLLK